MSDDKKPHGGQRKGAGRRPVEPELKRVPVPIKLPQWIADWLNEQEGSKSLLIERAVIATHKLKAPKVKP